uniref:L,D-transpeptidase family protein n=1 Tax=Acetatifactor sp. TaxID=1872090 RepID=UPI0040575875
MKRKAKSLLLICLMLLLLLFAGYFLLAYYYREGFTLNTWINGVYCTGKTVDEVNAELLSGMEAPIVIITDKSGEEYFIDLADADYQEDYLEALNQYKDAQNPWLWIDNITLHQSHRLEPKVSYDSELLHQAYNRLDFVEEEQQKKTDYQIEYSEEQGYYLYDGLNDRLDTEKLFAVLQEHVDAGVYELNVSEIDCCYDIPLNEDQEQIKELAQKLLNFQNCNVVYDMGDQMIPITAAIKSDFIMTENGEIILDENGNFVPDEEGIKAFVASLAEEYDTYEKEREFQSTRGDIVTVTGGTYGTQIDQEAEVEYLMEHILTEDVHSQGLLERIPVYEHEGIVRGKNDIGSTYIEVDMTDQKMYYYQDGELRLETDVVTGHTGRRNGTPEGIYYVYFMELGRILRGGGTPVYVDYWMAVVRGVGIHDADWRDEFGGTIYQNDGSHGCINTPKEKVAELYDMVETGTPVIMFY